MNLLKRLRERFWFVPATMCVLAVLLAEALIAIDHRFDVGALPGWANAIVFRVGESGSRDILGAIASASLSVAGTTFSITIAVLALTSSSYGPRLVRNFMADRGNQVVLGVYVATFLYSLLVLRSVRTLGDPTADAAAVFVPHLAVNVAVLLGMANVAVLVYFIHHISDSIQISTLASSLRSDLRQTVDRMYPEQVGHHGAPADGAARSGPTDLEQPGTPVQAGAPGYLQSLHADELFELACRHDVLLALQVRPGEYVLEDTVLVVIHPSERATEEIESAVRSSFQIANARSPFQDVEFAVQQLTEMAVRALSPGTNDPFTAMNALDDLSTGLAALVSRPEPSPARVDEDGRLRVFAPGFSATELVDLVLDNMRWYATGSPAVMHATLNFAGRIGRHARSPELRVHLAEQVGLLGNAFSGADHPEHDRRTFGERVSEMERALLHPSPS